MTRRPPVAATAPVVRALLAVLVAGAAALGPAAIAQTKAAPGAPAAQPGAASGAGDAHRRDDVARHRAISVAHEAAARCLESGRPEAECHEALRKACQGLAVGRWCGMKHSH